MHQRQCNTVMCKHCSTSGFNTDIHHQILTELPDYSKRLAVKIGKHFHVHHQAQQQQRPATVPVRRRQRRNLATTSTRSASSSSAPRLAFCCRYLSSRLSSTVVDNGPLLPGIVEAAVERRRRVRRQRRSVQTRRMIMVRQRSTAR